MEEGKDCEVCGAGNARIFAIIEGAKMRVCETCSKFGKVIEIERERVPKPSPKHIEIEEEIIEDYADVIKKAREKRGMTRSQLAALIMEKESVIKKVEAGELIPPDKLALKLQKALGIKLYEAVEEPPLKQSGQAKGSGITLGDLIEVKQKKK